MHTTQLSVTNNHHNHNLTFDQYPQAPEKTHIFVSQIDHNKPLIAADLSNNSRRKREGCDNQSQTPSISLWDFWVWKPWAKERRIGGGGSP